MNKIGKKTGKYYRTQKCEEWLRERLGWYRHSESQGKSVQHEMGTMVSFLERLKEIGSEKRAQNKSKWLSGNFQARNSNRLGKG